MLIQGNANIDLKVLYEELNELLPLEKLTIKGQTYPVSPLDLDLFEFILQYKQVNPKGYYDHLYNIFRDIAIKMQQHDHDEECMHKAPAQAYQTSVNYQPNEDIEYSVGIGKCIQDLYTEDYVPKNEEEYDKFLNTCDICSALNTCSLRHIINEKYVHQILSNLEKDKI